MPRKTKKTENERREKRREKEGRMKNPCLVLLTCEQTNVEEIYAEFGNIAMAKFAYKFPLNGKALEFERVAKTMADYLFIHFQKKAPLTKRDEETWNFKIRMIKASNPELKLFFNNKAHSIFSKGNAGKLIEQSQIKNIFA